MTIDTLKLAKGLQTRGFTAQQAEGLAEELNTAVREGVAGKSDFEQLRTSTQADFRELRADMRAMENRIMLRLVLAMIIVAGFALTIAKAIV
jgi:hypothetical protein